MFFSKKIYFPFILTSFVAVVGLYISIILLGIAGSFLLMKNLWWVLIPIAALFLFVLAYFSLVSVNLPISTYKNGAVNLKKTFSSVWDYKLILKSLGLIVIIAGSLFAVGYLLYIIASKIHPILIPILVGSAIIFIAIRLAFSLYILVETKGKVISSIKKSHEMMKGNGWKFLVFIIVISVISLFVQLIGNKFTQTSPIGSDIVTILFSIMLAPYFSLLTVSPYMQIKKDN